MVMEVLVKIESCYILTVIVIPEPAVHLQSNYYAISESGGSIEVCAEVTTDKFEGTFQAIYMTAGGSAKGLNTSFKIGILTIKA